jgi:hypothetical protein
MGTKELELIGVLAKTLNTKFEQGVEALKDTSVTDEKFSITLKNTMDSLQLSEQFNEMLMKVWESETKKQEATEGAD